MYTFNFIILQIKDTAAALQPQTGHTLNALELVMKGGFVMIPIGILLFVTLYILVERALTIAKFTRARKEDVQLMLQQLGHGDTHEAMNYCQRNENQILKVLEVGLHRLGRPASDIEEGMSSQVNIMISRLQQRLSYLGIIAGIAPMLGFIGTISGIIRIFYDISVSENISIGIIASGLYEKMVSSGSGLIVGILAYAGYHYLLIRIDVFAAKVEAAAFDFMNLIEEPVS